MREKRPRLLSQVTPKQSTEKFVTSDGLHQVFFLLITNPTTDAFF